MKTTIITVVLNNGALVRDAIESVLSQTYADVQYIVIDGGHRIRALRDYFLGKYKVNGVYYKDSDIDLNKIEIPMDIKVCTSAESIAIFRNLNETTAVNFIEMLMCDDQSVVCREVRSRTKYYREYDNHPHAIFDVTANRKGEITSKYFESKDVNPRRKWDEFVFVAICKAIGVVS